MQHTCVICGAAFERARRDSRYCTSECHAARKRDGLRPLKACRVCDAGFVPVATKQVYCSTECRRTPLTCALRWQVCPQGEHAFTATSGQYCDCRQDCEGRCGRQAALTRGARLCRTCQTKRLAARQRAKQSARRARLRGQFVEVVKPDVIFKRDGWRCQLCYEMVLRKAVVPHPRAAVMDHIEPLAAGGLHEYRNIHTAHFICNSLKREVGGGEQLLLIG